MKQGKIYHNSLSNWTDEQIPHYSPIVEPLPPPPHEYGNDLICIAIDPHFITYVVTALQIYAQKDVWQGDIDTQRWSKAQILSLWTSIANQESCENTMFDLRENPIDECEIQKSTDGGTTWVYAWRKDNCAPMYSKELLHVSLTGSFDLFTTKYLSIYNSDPLATFPETVYQSDGNNNYRDVAMCHAVRAVIDICLAAAIEHINDLNIWLDIGKAVLTIINTASSKLPGAVGLYLFVGTAIANAALDIFSTITLAAIEVYEDEETRQILACAMFESLYGETITFDRFNTALDNFTPTGVIEPIQVQAIKPFLQKVEIYLAFLSAMNDLLPYAKLGIIENCDCLEWEVVRLGGDGNANMQSLTIDGGLATYNATLDRYEGANGAGNKHALIVMESPLVPFFVTFVTADIHLDNNGTLNTTNYIAETSGEGDVGTFLATGINFVDGAHNLTVQDLDRQVLGIAFRLKAQSTTGHAWLNKVVIRGRGFNPFA